MRSRNSIAALPLALLVAAAPAFADAQQHAQAAKKAERHGDWSKALDEWKAAYSQDINAEYLIGIGDAYAKLGNKAEAKKNYEAYLNDPLALPTNLEKVRTKVASLAASPGLELPGAGPGLELPGAAAAPPSLAGAPGLDLPGVPVETGKKGKRGKKGAAEVAPPPGMGLDLPGAPPAEVAKKPADPGLGLPALDLAAAAPSPSTSKKGADKKAVASASPPGMGLELPGVLPSEPSKPAVATSTPPAHSGALASAAPALAHVAAPPPPAHVAPAPAPSHGSSNAKPIASAAPTGAVRAVSAQPERKREAVPEAAIAEIPQHRSAEVSSGGHKAIAFVTAGVALAALGGGAYAYTLSTSAHSEATSGVHDGRFAEQRLNDEARNKTISFIGLAGGLVAAGIATALFAF
jgi:hypothetical protein